MTSASRVTRALEIAVGLLLVLGLVASRLLPIPALILSLPFLALLTFKPVLRRLALGHIARRPRETALVILGSLLGTAIITGSFVVGDTLDASIKQTIFTKLGPIDELVSAPPGGAPAVDAALKTLPPAEVDGIMPLTTLVVTSASTDATPKAEPTTQLVEVDFAAARDFGGDPAATGITGPTPAPGEAAIGEDLAKTLDATPGDVVRIFAFGLERQFTVVRVLPRIGVAGFDQASQGSKSSTVFVQPGTAADLFASRTVEGEPPSELFAISNTGGVAEGAERTDRVKQVIEQSLAGAPASIVTAKANVLDDAKQTGDQFTQLFTMIGLFSVLAGILLLVNIFVMLAQERQSELGMLRAVGLRRLGLVGAFSLEGWMYAVASAALGTIVGLGVGRVIVQVASGIFAGGGPGGEGGLDLTYSATRGSINGGFLLGFVISLVTVLGTSIRISRLNVIRAIRDLPEPKVVHRRLITLVLGAVALLAGVGMTMAGVGNGNAVFILVGPVLAGVGFIRVLAGVTKLRVGPLDSRRLVASTAATFIILWSIFAFALFPEAFRDTEIIVFVLQGVILVAWGVVLLSQNQEIIGAVVRRAGGGSRSMSLRLGLAYPLARRFRTAMTLAMYALVVYMLATITMFSHLFGSQLDSFSASISGGYDLVANSNASNPIALEQLQAVPGVARAAAIAQTFGTWTGPKVDGELGWPAGAFDESYIAAQAPSLAKRPPQYATDGDAYRAVLADPNLFIPTAFFLQRGGGGPPTPVNIGERYTVRDTVSGRSRTLTVAAVAESGFGNLRPLMSYEALRDVFGARTVPNIFYVEAASGVDAQEVAERINGSFVANGADADSFAKNIDPNLSQQQQFFGLMRGYLALGLVVGIAGLGVVMVRAVRERRREVGVLRSLGFGSKAVRRAFVAESAFVASEGIGLGTFLAVITVWRLTGNADFGAQLSFSVPVVALLSLMIFTMVASLLATATPAQQASKIRPAVALRIAD